MIFKKDGSIYQLRGPNPIMSQQKLWDADEKLVLHNCKWKAALVDKPVKEQSSNFKPQTPELPTSNENSLQISDQVPDEPVEVEFVESVELEITKTEATTLDPNIKRTIMHCLQAEEYDVVDELYGDVRKKYKFKTQFTVEVVILSITDLSLVFWTTKNLNRHSIVYPLNNEKRWWQISNVDEHEKFVHTAIPTDWNPNFTQDVQH